MHEEHYESTVGLCATCYARAPGEIVLREGAAWLRKTCSEHGVDEVLIADDADYYRMARERFQTPGGVPLERQTETVWGCPYDCGLCPDHDQHSCLTVVEVCDACNLSCPVCYASSGPERSEYRSLREIEAMLDAVVASEGEPDIVQISGGEPTLHPDFFRILDLARERPIRHLMLNTNGVRIAEEREFAERLAGYGPGFEVYLQYDSQRAEVLRRLRGTDLSDVRQRALQHLNAVDLSTTLVVTLQRGVNDDECGAILERALAEPCVRGVTFQPIQDAGRTHGYDAQRDRLTVSEVRRRIAEQSDVFELEDLLPVPCHPECIAMAYAVRDGTGGAHAVTRYVDTDTLVRGASNTIRFEAEAARGGLLESLVGALSTGHSPESGAQALGKLLCCLPSIEGADGSEPLGYRDVFRVIVMRFLDVHDLELRSVRRSCVHMARPDGRLIPFDTYNLFYRDDLEERRLAGLRESASAPSS